MLTAPVSGVVYAIPSSVVTTSGVQQVSKCSGIVKDATGEPIIGASVMVKGTTNGVVTDIDGRFELGGVKTGDVIVISYLGHETQEMKWTGSDLNVVLKQDTKTLSEVVVVGFGTQKKVNLTGAVTSVSAKEINARPVNSVVDALQGVVPGMNIAVSGDGGSLEASKSFNIRGAGTIGAGSSVSPLVLIDGMEGNLNLVNPQDIENISVLKDASASSIYGSRAAGGVILVTTRQGKAGKTSVTYNNSFRFNSPLNMPKMMDSYTWALYMNEASVNAGNGVWIQPKQLEQIKAYQQDPSAPYMWKNSDNKWEVWDIANIPAGNTDWLREHFGNSTSQEHNISVSGGNDKIKYYLSGNMLSQGGLLRHGNDARKRYSVNAKIDVAVNRYLDVLYNMRFTRVDITAPTYYNDWYFYHNVMRYWPIVPTVDPNGHYVPESFIEDLKNGGRKNIQKDVIAQQLAFRIKPMKGLLINAEFNYRIDTYNQHKDWITTYGYNVFNNPYIIRNENSAVYEYNSKSNYFNPNIYAEYSFDINEAHNFKVMMGYQSEWNRPRSFWAQQFGILSGLPTLDTTSKDPKVGGDYTKWTTCGFFGRLNYDYMGRYLFEANLRYDGSSRFTREKRWNWFPSFSAGWNIAQEGFWEPLRNKVNLLKLRASWGMLGNQNTDNWYPFYPVIDFETKKGNWLVNGEKPNIASEPALVSALLGWEKSRTWEIGLDWGAFNNRLTGSFGYYQRKTYDMVGPAPELPEVLGADVPKVNNLDMTSKGWDLQVAWRDRIGEFAYGAALTLSDNRVKIDKYPNPARNLDRKYYPGAYLGDIWGYTTVGIAKSQEEMDAHLKGNDQSALGSNWTAGDIMYADLDGDGKVNGGEGTVDKPGDRRIIGNSTPRYNFGLNLDAAYKGFDLKVFFQGTLKRDFWPGSDSGPFWGASGISQWQAQGFEEHLDYFRADANNPLGQNLESYYPRVSWNGSRNNYIQTRYLQNAAYCRLKNVTLGYTLPRSITQRFYVQNMRFYVSAENLLTITSFSKMADPELVGANRGGFGKVYPLSKTFSFGLSVTF